MVIKCVNAFTSLPTARSVVGAGRIRYRRANMQCGEIMYHKVSSMLNAGDAVATRISKRPEKEAIHSGHFMVSHFEAEEQDDEDEVAVPVPEDVARHHSTPSIQLNFQPVAQYRGLESQKESSAQHLSIETSLSKLFQCMSLAYRWVKVR